jgi:hypothetical protein
MRGRLAWLFARVVFTSLVFLFLLRIGVGAGLAIALNHVEERYDLAVEVEDFGLQLAPLQLTLRTFAWVELPGWLIFRTSTFTPI